MPVAPHTRSRLSRAWLTGIIFVVKAYASIVSRSWTPHRKHMEYRQHRGGANQPLLLRDSLSSPSETSHATHPDINTTISHHAFPQPPDTIPIPEWTDSINSIGKDSSYSFTRTTWTVTAGRTDVRETLCQKFSYSSPIASWDDHEQQGIILLHGTTRMGDRDHESQSPDHAGA